MAPRPRETIVVDFELAKAEGLFRDLKENKFIAIVVTERAVKVYFKGLEGVERDLAMALADDLRLA